MITCRATEKKASWIFSVGRGGERVISKHNFVLADNSKEKVINSLLNKLLMHKEEAKLQFVFLLSFFSSSLLFNIVKKYAAAGPRVMHFQIFCSWKGRKCNFRANSRYVIHAAFYSHSTRRKVARAIVEFNVVLHIYLYLLRCKKFTR